MEGEAGVDKVLVQEKNSSPPPRGLPINWNLITGPVREPIFSTSPSILPQDSAVHSLQTKLKTFGQRRQRGREKDKERSNLVSHEGGLCGIAPEIYLRPKEKGKSLAPVTIPPCRSRTARNLSTSDEDQEVEVEVKLEIHSPPAETQMLSQGAQEASSETGQNITQCKSLESLLSDNINHEKPKEPLQAAPSVATSSSTNVSSTFTTSTRHWAPPKGFWRIARPETLLLSGVTPSTLPIMDYTKIDEKCKEPAKTDSKCENVGVAVDDADAPGGIKHSDSMECYLEKCEQKEMEAKGLCNANNVNTTSQSPPSDDTLTAKQKAYAKLRERQQSRRVTKEPGGESADQTDDTDSCVTTDFNQTTVNLTGTQCLIRSSFLSKFRSLLVISDELPLSPRHEQAKRLLERARLKARSNHMKGDGVSRRVEPDQSDVIKKQQFDSDSPTRVQKAVQTKEELSPPSVYVPLLLPEHRDTSPSEQTGRTRRYGCSPTRVRFEDESEKEAQSRYLDRVRQRGRSKSRENNQDASSGKNQRSVSVPPALVSVETQTVVREIIVVVKKCEACGSIARETQAVTSPSEPQNTDLQQLTSSEDPRTKQASKPVNTRPKAPLTVTFAGAYVLGEDKEVSSGWKSSGFGKLRRRSRKGESRIESGHGPYGPSWAQRRNSNPRNRVNMPRGVTFAPGSPIALEPRLLEASGGTKELTGPPLPIKSALKSSSRNRVSPNQSVVQFQAGSSAGVEGDIEHDQSEVRRESSPVSLNQSAASTNSPVSCIRPSTLRYSPARMTSDLPDADLWDSAPDGPAGLCVEGSGGVEGRPILRNMALSRSDDLRADLLRAEHLKAEAMWEDSPDGSRKLDGRPKLFLRRFFSSIGLNSVGRLVKGSRSSSMEQLSLPPAPRASSASPSPTRRPQPTIRIQRTPSLQTLHTVFPLAQLRKASSVQSLERRTERSTILGEVQIPYGLAPSPESPQLALHRALSVENVLVSRMGRPVGRVTQAFADGTLLLELTKPPNGPFGFVISRGKGRPDTGVYVEKVGDGSGEGLYVGLLGVGDEILQVNGEAVAGLALDQVTRLMTRDSTASLRIMPARHSPR
ncbi:hypothetical protein NQD34_012615 [Periophthalmus magnuspinnatus]|nr:hypothetical protein NQD34_012615 [Periophthalmus magnuspinnatus]